MNNNSSSNTSTLIFVCFHKRWSDDGRRKQKNIKKKRIVLKGLMPHAIYTLFFDAVANTKSKVNHNNCYYFNLYSADLHDSHLQI